MKIIEMIRAEIAMRKAEQELIEAKSYASSASMRAASVVESVSKMRAARKIS